MSTAILSITAKAKARAKKSKDEEAMDVVSVILELQIISFRADDMSRDFISSPSKSSDLVQISHCKYNVALGF